MENYFGEFVKRPCPNYDSIFQYYLLTYRPIHLVFFYTTFETKLKPLARDIRQKTMFLKNLIKATGKYICWSPILNKFAGCKACKFIKNETGTSVFLSIIHKTFTNGCFKPNLILLYMLLHHQKYIYIFRLLVLILWQIFVFLVTMKKCYVKYKVNCSKVCYRWLQCVVKKIP